MSTDVLNESLAYRQGKIQQAIDYLEQTQKLFDRFGSIELKTVHAKFAELLDALNANEVRLVVIGEFSRGKSSLINALLGITLLPMAQEATTAINTFVRSLPSDHYEKFIRIHYQDGSSPKDLDWVDDHVLRKWGTELDASHANARKTVDYIEVFMRNELLENGLVVIDTPGLESVMQHHEAITRKAIAESHIALWVQSTTQLGGVASEWKFLAETIRTNFNKFVTVINFWDKVLEPEDQHDKEMPESARIREKLKKVKDNFKLNLPKQSDAELNLLTNSEHLMGVSARWAMSDDVEKQKRSGVSQLAERIANMFSSDEAVEEIFRKPLRQLRHIQVQLNNGLTDELQQISSDKTLEERKRELELFDKDIQLLEEESKRVAGESKDEHRRVASVFENKVKMELVQPLSDLKEAIETELDARYIKRCIENRTRQIGLPEQLNQQFREVSDQVMRAWERQKQELQQVLEGLRADYAKQMTKHAQGLKTNMANIDIDVPNLDVGFGLDFSAIEDHHHQALKLQQEIEARKNQIDEMESEKEKYMANAAALEMARQAMVRAERSIEVLGGQPTARSYSESVRTSDGGMYSSPKYSTVQRTDDSNVKAWMSERDELKKGLLEKETRLNQIVADEERKTGQRMSIERAQKKYEKEVADFERKHAEFEKRKQQEEADMVEETRQKLIRSTAGQLEQRIRYLQEHAAKGVNQIFADQLALLESCVQEQYFEPLNAKRAKRSEVQTVLQQGEQAISARKAELLAAQQMLADLQIKTETACIQ